MMKTITSALTSAALLLAYFGSARAESATPLPPEAQIVDRTGHCPEGVKLITTPGEKITLDLGGFEARADAEQARSRVLCVVKVQLEVQPGYKVRVEAPEIAYRVEHTASGSSNLSVRLFAAGEPGLSWFKSISGDAASGDFTETPTDWNDKWHECGKAPALSLLVDAAARLRPDAAQPEGVETIAVQSLTLPALTYKRCTTAPQVKE